MSTLPSNFTCPEKIYDVLLQLSNSSINSDDLSAQCPDVCSIAWGTGNPDLSGIGAYTAYLIQGVLTLLFQFPFIIFYVSSTNKRRRNLVHLYETFFKTYALFNISILVAAIVRHTSSNGESGYESIYTNFLAQFVSIGILAVQSTPLIIKLLETLLYGPDDFTWPFTLTKVLLFILVFLCNLTAALYKSISREPPVSFARLYPQLVDMCKQYATVKRPQGWTGWVWTGSCVLVIFTMGAVYFLHVRQKSGKKMPKVAIRAISFTMLIIFVGVDILCAWLLKQLRDCRNDLHTIMGDEFEDNLWGFGQVLAIFIWADAVASIIWQAGRATVKRTRTLTWRKDSQSPGNGWPNYPLGQLPEETLEGAPKDGLWVDQQRYHL